MPFRKFTLSRKLFASVVYLASSCWTKDDSRICWPARGCSLFNNDSKPGRSSSFAYFLFLTRFSHEIMFRHLFKAFGRSSILFYKLYIDLEVDASRKKSQCQQSPLLLQPGVQLAALRLQVLPALLRKAYLYERLTKLDTCVSSAPAAVYLIS